jgi:exosortase/archaeosortase family protein
MGESVPKKARVRPGQAKLAEILWFLVRLNLLGIPMYLIMWTGLSLPPLQTGLAAILHLILSLSGYGVSRDGYLLSVTGKGWQFNFVIDMDCTGWKSLWALTALVLATPGRPRRGLKFLAGALPALFVINIVRITSTIALISVFGLEWLGLVHTILWREGLIAAVLLLWLWWLRNFRR